MDAFCGPEDILERVARMERAFDEVREALDRDPAAAREDPAVREQLRLLTDYYESGIWLRDYEIDERGELPPDLKRGVLSQDGVYNLLYRIGPLAESRQKKQACKEEPVMIHLIPSVKKLTLGAGALARKAVCCGDVNLDSRILAAVRKLPCDSAGVPLQITVAGETGEGYVLDIEEDAVSIVSEGPAGAFYAVQTLRQLFARETVPCLHIEDKPDFAHRGFYHDATRGKIPSVETLKQLIDRMAYYKLNSLQLYVEHTFAFEEYRQLHETTGCLTKEELLQIGDYCRENFIEFIPSLSTFGHLYELLELPQYRHLRVLKDFEAPRNFWASRMAHHTIDPENPESIALIKSLIDQYVPCFESEWFNICCDETFDLKIYDGMGRDSGELYVTFVKQIIEHVRSKGKKVMMWADILLKHPETIGQIPSDTCFLNWNYRPEPPEEKVLQLAQSGRTQIVCPGTTSWNRLCERVDVEEQNICRMAEYGYRHGAVGLLNTNWGDWANPCSLETAMYGMVLGAEKSWTVATPVDDAFYDRVNALLYENENGMCYLNALSDLHNMVSWQDLCRAYFERRYGEVPKKPWKAPNDITAVQQAYTALAEKLAAETWTQDEYRQEMLLAAEGVCVMAELLAKLAGLPVCRVTDTHSWLARYREKWLQKNKAQELPRMEAVFTYCESI